MEENKVEENKNTQPSQPKENNKQLYPNPPKTLEEAKARVGKDIELDEYGLVKEPTTRADEWAHALMGIFGIATPITLVILFCGKMFFVMLDLLILGLGGLLAGGIVGYIIGYGLGYLFTTNKEKKKYEEDMIRCKQLNKKYNLVRIEPVNTSVSGSRINRCPECGGIVEHVQTEHRVGDIGIGDVPADRTKTTYKCKNCGFVYYSITTVTKKHKTTENAFTDKLEHHVIRTETVEYRTDQKCSAKALLILKGAGSKRVNDEFEDAKAEMKQKKKDIKSGKDW